MHATRIASPHVTSTASQHCAPLSPTDSYGGQPHRSSILQGVRRLPHRTRRSSPISSQGARTSGWQTLGQTCSRGDPGSAICVQRLDDSLNSAIHTRYRSLLRSSSMHEPRDPPSEVVKIFDRHITQSNPNGSNCKKTKCQKEENSVRGPGNGHPMSEMFPDLSAAPEFTPAAHLPRTERGSPPPTAGAR